MGTTCSLLNVLSLRIRGIHPGHSLSLNSSLHLPAGYLLHFSHLSIYLWLISAFSLSQKLIPTITFTTYLNHYLNTNDVQISTSNQNLSLN